MIYIILVISCLLDYLFLSFIKINSILFPLFSLMALIIVYPFFKKRQFNRFLVACSALGIVYDIVFTDMRLLNVGTFLLVGLIIKLIFKTIPNNLLSGLLVGLITIVFYRITTYMVLVLAGYLDFSFIDLFCGIYSSLIVNIGYIIMFYLLSLFFSRKYKIERFS